MSILFAATYPTRVDRLVLYGSYATPRDGGAGSRRLVDRPDRDDVGDRRGARRARWGSHRRSSDPTAAREVRAPVRDPGRGCGSHPHGVAIDVRPILDAVKVPTLVLHRTEDPNLRIDGARELAAGIPGARLVELDGREHLPWAGDGEPIVEEIEEFVTGSRHALVADRVLATVLFTDIVGSTTRAAELGDADVARPARAPPRGGAFRARALAGTGGGRPPATASWPPSTAPPAPSGAPRRSSTAVAPARRRAARRAAHRRDRADG